MSSGLFELREGTLYPILHALEEDGCVEAEWVGEEGERQRKYYYITKEGRALLKEKKSEWVRFRTAMDRVVIT